MPVVVSILYISVFVYIVMLLTRLVRAVEKIADKIDDSPNT